MKRRIALGVTRTLALYGFAGWVYIALVALVHPATLVLQLTHFTKLPHEDTFGEICFVVSAVSFFIYSLLRSTEKSGDGSAARLSTAGLTTVPARTWCVSAARSGRARTAPNGGPICRPRAAR